MKSAFESRSVACTNPDDKSKLNESVIEAGYVVGTGGYSWNSSSAGAGAGRLGGGGRLGAVVSGSMGRGGSVMVGACRLGRRRGRCLVSRSGGRTSPVPGEIKFTNRDGRENREKTLGHIDSTPAAGRALIDNGSRLRSSLIVDGDLLATSGPASEVSRVHGNSMVARFIKTSAGNFSRSNIVIGAWNTVVTFSERTSNVPVGASFDIGRSLVAVGAGQDGRRGGKNERSGEKAGQFELHLYILKRGKIKDFLVLKLV